MSVIPRHRVFVSFHHDDQPYKELFVRMVGDDIVDKSVGDGDIDDARLATDTIRQRIRDDFIRDATVTVVLIGRCTWQRKHVDWEIGSSLRDTRLNSRCGLLGVLLPDHWNFAAPRYQTTLIPPRLADNCQGADPYARVYDWPGDFESETVRGMIHRAFERRTETPPDNSRRQFGRNRSGRCSDGWTE